MNTPRQVDRNGALLLARAAADSAPVLIWMSGPEKEGIYFNQAWLDFTGRPADEQLGEGWLELVHPDDRRPLDDACAEAFRNRRPFTAEFRLRRRDGEYRWMLDTGTPRFEPSGEFAGFTGSCVDITDQKRVDDALRESDERFTRFMRHLPGLAWIKDLQGRYVYANEAAESAFDVPRESLYGKTDEEIFPGEVAAAFRENDRQALASEAGVQVIETLEHADGVLHHSIVSKFPISGPDGRPILVGGVAFDVTKRKLAEEALRESEERFRTLANNSPAAVFVKDLDGRYTVANPLASEALGKPEGAVGFTDHDLLPADVADELQRVDAEVIASGRAVQNEEVVRRPGYLRRFLSVKFPLFDVAGRPKGVCGVAIDVTDRHRAEESLRESEERFRTLADNIAQLAWMADANGSIFWFNRRWFDYTGTDLESMQGWGWQKVHHPDHVQRVVEKFRRCIEAGEVWEDTFPLRGRDGAYRWFLSRAIPVRDDAGRVLRWFGTNTDVTAQRDAEERLRESDRRKDEFLAMLAHELRNPLVPIRSGLDVLSGELGDDHEIIRLMREQIEHVVRLVDDLLDMSRIVRGHIELRKAPVELSAVIYRAVSAVEAAIESRGHELRIAVPREELWLTADPVRMVQIVENLLNNAAKYTDAGGTIELLAECSGSELSLSVRDNGVGIEPDLLPRIFDLFAQSSRSLDRSQGGLGIGLTLVRKLVESHGGRISVASAGPGTGSEFTVHLPVSKPPAASRTLAASGTLEPPASIPPRKILIVEDNQAVARMLTLLLARQDGHCIETAHDGAAALSAMHAFRPHVVLLDIGLPGMDGYEVAETIRKDREFDGALLVALTGYGQQDDVARSQAAGFDEHLVKPPALDDLQRLLSHPRLHIPGISENPWDVEAGPAKVRKAAPRPAGVPLEDPETSHVADSLRESGSELAERVPRTSSRPTPTGNHSQIRSAIHELGNFAHAIRLAAHILKTTNDPSNVQTVREILEDIDASMGTLGRSLRDTLPPQR